MGQVYGFRQYPKRAETYVHPYSGVAIAIPALDLLMRQDGAGVVTDRTGYCLVPGTRGFFSEGYMKVEEAFDNGITGILQNNGEIGQIRKAYSRQYNGPVYSIKARVCPRVTLTQGHEVLVVDKADFDSYKATVRSNKYKGRSCELRVPASRWTSVENVQPGDAVLVPRPKLDKQEQIIDFDIATDKDHCFIAFSQGRTPQDLYPEVSVLRASVDRYAAAWRTGASEKWVRYPAYSPMVLDADMCRFFGWYVAEGNADVKSGRIVLTLGYNESDATEWISEYATRVFGMSVCVTVGERDHTRRIHFSSQKLARFLVTEFGHGARNKHLPAWLLNSTDACAVAFISAFIDGDGCVLDMGKIGYKPRISIITSSERMVCDLSALLMRLDILPMIHHMNKEGNFEFEPGRIVHQHDGWEFRITGEDVNKLRPNLSDTLGTRRYMSDESFFYCRVSKVEEGRYDGTVYDFETDTHTLGMPFIIHNSNNGLCNGCVGARGVFDEGQKFDGVNDTINCGSNPSLDIAQDISAVCWVNEAVPTALSVLMFKTNGILGWYLGMNGLSRPQIYFYNGGAGVGGGGGVSIALLRWAHVGFAVAGTVARVFADGLEFARGIVTMSDDGASPLVIVNSGGNRFNGSIELPQVFSGALSPEQIYRKYLEASACPIYLDDFGSYPVDFAAKTVGAMCGPFRVLNNPMIVTVDTSARHWVSGTTINSIGRLQLPEVNGYGTLTHRFKRQAGKDHFFFWIDTGQFFVAQNGYAVVFTSGGTVRLYRYTAGVFALVIFNNACVTADNTDYECKLVRRVGGQWCVYLKGGAFIDWTLVGGPATDNTYTNLSVLAPQIDNGGAVSAISLLRVCERPASFPWEFLSGTYAGLVSGSTVWANCLTAGVLFTPKDLDWQTAIFGIRKAAATTADILFVASEIGDAGVANQNGYLLRFDGATGIISLCRTTGGVVAVIATTAAAFFAAGVDYEIKVTRNWTTNAYDVLILGGAYADWTSTGLAAVLAIYVSSNYTNFNLTANDRISAPTYYRDIR